MQFDCFIYEPHVFSPRKLFPHANYDSALNTGVMNCIPIDIDRFLRFLHAHCIHMQRERDRKREREKMLTFCNDSRMPFYGKLFIVMALVRCFQV